MIPPRVLSGVLLGLAVAACDMPRDPGGTLERVRGGTLRAGVVNAPPWIEVDGDAVTGYEADLVLEIARALDARVAWHMGPPEELMAALEARELDLVAGGLTRGSPWSRHVGLTRPYLESRVTVGVAEGLEPVQDLEGCEIAVRPGGPLASLLRNEGARPRVVDEPARAGLPWADEEWPLRRAGFTPGPLELTTHERALAVPPGENAWLLELDRCIAARRDAP